LYRLTDGPVLPVDKVPEVPGVTGVESRFRDLLGREQQIAGDLCAIDRGGPEDERSHMFRRQRQQQVRIHQLTLVPNPFGVIEIRERHPVRRARQGERPCALAVWDAVVPREVGTTTGEGGDQPGQFRMDRAAVVALL
jgi:hypothetical protein